MTCLGYKASNIFIVEMTCSLVNKASSIFRFICNSQLKCGMQTTVLCVRQKMTVRGLKTTLSKTLSICANVHRLLELVYRDLLMFADISFRFIPWRIRMERSRNRRWSVCILVYSIISYSLQKIFWLWYDLASNIETVLNMNYYTAVMKQSFGEISSHHLYFHKSSTVQDVEKSIQIQNMQYRVQCQYSYRGK
jgi:hypothetical protein